MSGYWTYREADIHKCTKPPYDDKVRKLDRWKCDQCKTEWIVSRIVFDQKDGNWLVWDNYETWKSVPFPPGTK